MRLSLRLERVRRLTRARNSISKIAEQLILFMPGDTNETIPIPTPMGITLMDAIHAAFEVQAIDEAIKGLMR